MTWFLKYGVTVTAEMSFWYFLGTCQPILPRKGRRQLMRDCGRPQRIKLCHIPCLLATALWRVQNFRNGERSCRRQIAECTGKSRKREWHGIDRKNLEGFPPPDSFYIKRYPRDSWVLYLFLLSPAIGTGVIA